MNFNKTISFWGLIILISGISVISFANIASPVSNLQILEESADSLAKMDKYFEALDKYQRCLEQHKIRKNYDDALRLLEKSANLYSYLDDYTSALNSYLDALNMAEELNKTDRLQSLHFNIGTFHLRLQNSDKALEHLFKSLELIDQNNPKNKSKRLDVYLALGTAYASEEEYHSSVDYYHKALLLAKQTQDSVLYAGILNNLGSVKMKQEEYTTAEDYFNEAQDIFTNTNDKRGMGLSLFNIGIINAETGNTGKAIRHITKASKIFEEISSLSTLYKSHLYLSRLYESSNQPDSALSYLKKHIQLKDSVLNNQTLEELYKIRESYIQEKARQEQQILSQENKILQQESKLKQNRYLILSGGLILLILAAGFIIFRQKTKLRINALNTRIITTEKEKLSDELHFKSKELENLAMHIVRKNNFVQQLKIEAKNNQAEKAPTTLSKITKLIDKQLYLDEDRKEFELYANEVHQNFLNKLDKHFPKLTMHDKKLCTLIILGLDSKQIASIQNISVSSVKKARYRLRKKFNITGEVKLADFLKTL
jgi:tetratricopeptide (TPR) repeat protein